MLQDVVYRKRPMRLNVNIEPTQTKVYCYSCHCIIVELL